MSSRFIEHDEEPPHSRNWETVQSRIKYALADSEEQVLQHYTKRHMTSGSVYIGVEGALVMEEYLKSSESTFLSSIPSALPDKLLGQIIEAQRRHGFTIRSGARASFLETGIGVAVVALLSELRRGGSGPFKNEVQPCLELLRRGINLALKDEGGLPDDGCEVLYGRAGLLYALLCLRRKSGRVVESPLSASVLQETSEDVLQSIVDEIMHRGHVGSAEYRKHYQGSGRTPALMWSWHGRRYLGGAHGVAGILQMILRCPLPVIKSHMKTVIDTVEWLVSLQDPSGNWPHKASTHGVSDDADMVQWCHGAPAVVILLSSLVTREDLSEYVAPNLHASIMGALGRASDLVYSRGFLRKGVGLCHGVSGSVFALLAAAKAFSGGSTPSNSASEHAILCVRRATHLAILALDWRRLTEDGEMIQPDRPWSLYEGLAGMCAAWVAILQALAGVPARGMPGYDDID